MKTYIVKRQHYGDRFYSEGEEREANAADVRHLLERGVLEEKAAPKPKNKAVTAPKNKAND